MTSSQVTPANTAEDFLRRWIGLDPTTIGSTTIQRAVRLRMEATGTDSQPDFLARIRADERERDLFVEEIVVAESWFFRDRQVFEFVRRFVSTLAALPHRVPVRILCAPCAAGEEPYSLAMDLLDAGLLPEQFTIDAIDVSHRSLERAALASYSANAFRNADLTFRDRWFRSQGGASVLDEKVRACVHFAWGNLLDESFVTQRSGYDVIFCRNLLIYLTDTARASVQRTLDTLLKPDGLLILGAAEPAIIKGEWIPAGATSAFAIRRGVRTAGTYPPLNSLPAKSLAARRLPSTDKSPEPATLAVPSDPPPLSLPEVLHEAGLLANALRSSDALAFCETQQKALGPSPELFFLMGMLHQSGGDLDRAEGCFHKTLYLDASHEEALLSLALIAAQRGDHAMADMYRQSATRAFVRKASS